MDLRGQRFTLDLSDDDEAGVNSTIPSTAVPAASPFIGDIIERSTAPPTAPQLKPTPTGFPEYKKRTRPSAFRQQRGAAVKPAPPDSSAAAQPPVQAIQPRDDPLADAEERRRIDEENKQRLASMSAEMRSGTSCWLA